MCAHAVRVAVRGIEGVDSVQVSLNEGFARIWFVPVNSVTIENVREAIRHNGFTPKDAEVRIAGRIVERDDSLLLVAPGLGRPFRLRAAPDSTGVLPRLRQEARGRDVVMGARVPEAGRGSAAAWELIVDRFTVFR